MEGWCGSAAQHRGGQGIAYPQTSAQHKVLSQWVDISCPLSSSPSIQATIILLLDGVRSLLTSQSPPGSQSDLFAFQRSFKILSQIKNHPPT